MRKSLLLFFALNAGIVSAQIGGNASYSFLNLVSSARVGAMGGNLIAVKDNDVSLAMYNPALLNKGMDNSLSFSYVNYFSDINFGYASYAKHIDSIGTFSATFNYLNYGKFEARDETGVKTGDFNVGDYVLTLGAGREIDSNFSIGANLKTIYSGYYLYNSFGMAVDLGGTYSRQDRGFTASLLAKNIGYQFKPYQKGMRESLPFEVQLAVSKKLKHAPFRFSLAMENLQKWDLSYIDPTIKPTIDPSTGKEIPIKAPGFGDKLMRHAVIGAELVTKNFFLGFGFNYKRRKELHVNDHAGIAGFSFGMGLKIKKIQFSYALATYNQSSLSNHITVSFNLNEFRK